MEPLYELARRVGPTGGVCAVDIAEPLLARARERCQAAKLSNVQFVSQDAASVRFDRHFDAVFSRFGVMFFAGAVAGFRNLREALVPGGRMAFVCWQHIDRNPWAKISIDAVLSAVPGATVPELLSPNRPGPFHFGDALRLQQLLAAAGFEQIAIEPEERELQMGAEPTPSAAVDCCVEIGPAARVVQHNDPSHLPAIRAALTTALTPYTSERGTWMNAATFVVSAVAARR